MKNEHLTEFEIQEYLFNGIIPDKEVFEHMQQCEKCRMMAGDYKSLFEDVSKQKRPVFEKDLTEKIMRSLPVLKPDFSFSKLLIYFLVVIVFPVSGILVLLFRSYSSILEGVSPLFIYLIVTTVISLSVAQLCDTYIHYKKHIDILNSYQSLQH
jgi:predicted anti-sigma-YlaC factor YlaD